MDSLPFNAVDVVVVLVLLISGILAWARGLVHEVLSVGGWLGAGAIAVYGLPVVRPFARQMISVEMVADFVAGIALFIIALVVLSLATRAISGRIRDSALNVLDRSLGFVFGLLRGAAIVCAVYLGAEWALAPKDSAATETAEEKAKADQEKEGPWQPDWLLEARSFQLIEYGGQILAAIIPDDVSDAGDKARADAKRKAKEALDQEAEKLIKGIIKPPAEQPKTDPDKPVGYEDTLRKAMDSLTDRVQQ